MNIGYVLYFGVEGSCVSASGVARKVVNTFTYATLNNVFWNPTKLAWWNVFQPQVWAPIAALLPAPPSGWAGQHSWVWNVNQPVGIDTPADQGVPMNGAVVGARLPLTQCAYCLLRTPSRGRSYTGSKRMGPLALAQTTGDELTPAAQAAWQAALANFLMPLTAVGPGGPSTVFPVVWSRQLSAAPGPSTLQIGDQVTTAHVNLTLGQWKHRRERVVR